MMYPSEETNKKKKESSVANLSSSYRKAAPYINSVYVIIAAIAIVGGFGWFGDNYFQTKPMLTVMGIFGGLGVGFYSFFKSLKQLEKNNN